MQKHIRGRLCYCTSPVSLGNQSANVIEKKKKVSSEAQGKGHFNTSFTLICYHLFCYHLSICPRVLEEFGCDGAQAHCRALCWVYFWLCAQVDGGGKAAPCSHQEGAERRVKWLLEAALP